MSTALRYVYHVALARRGEARVLLLPSPDGWRLPGFGGSERRFWQDVAHVNRGLREHFGAEALTLRCLALDYRRDQELVSTVYAAVLRDASWAPPPGARWVGRAELASLPLATEAHRAPLSEWFAWYGSAPQTRLRAPWYLPGWHEDALAWAAERLGDAGLAPTGPAEQLRAWQRSTILRLPTVAGAAYLKAVPPIFGHEPALTAALAAAHPTSFPRVIAFDPDRGWLLMRELPGPLLDAQRDDVATWERALASFAELQIASVARVPQLRALGVPERPLEALAARLGPLLGAMAAATPASPAGLTPEERGQLRALGPRLQAMAAELAAFGLPAALEHGDFWAGQVVVGAEGFGFLDWSDSSIAHPFFSLLLFLVEIEDYFPRVPGVRERLRDAYLAPWAAAGFGDDLVRPFELAQPLAALHHALAYHTRVLPNLEVQWELELMLPFYLKMAVRVGR